MLRSCALCGRTIFSLNFGAFVLCTDCQDAVAEEVRDPAVRAWREQAARRSIGDTVALLDLHEDGEYDDEDD